MHRAVEIKNDMFDFWLQKHSVGKAPLKKYDSF